MVVGLLDWDSVVVRGGIPQLKGADEDSDGIDFHLVHLKDLLERRVAINFRGTLVATLEVVHKHPECFGGRPQKIYCSVEPADLHHDILLQMLEEDPLIRLCLRDKSSCCSFALRSGPVVLHMDMISTSDQSTSKGQPGQLCALAPILLLCPFPYVHVTATLSMCVHQQHL